MYKLIVKDILTPGWYPLKADYKDQYDAEIAGLKLTVSGKIESWVVMRDYELDPIRYPIQYKEDI